MADSTGGVNPEAGGAAKRLRAELQEAAFVMREVAGTLESERVDWERRAFHEGASSSPPHYLSNGRRIEQLREELAWQRDKLRKHAGFVENLLAESEQ